MTFSTKYPVLVEGAVDIVGILLGAFAGAVVLPVFYAANGVVWVGERVRDIAAAFVIGVCYLVTGDLA